MGSIKIPAFVDRFHDFDWDCPIHVAMAVLKADKWGRKRVVSGRGGTRGEAASRCLYEAVERHAAVFDEGREVAWGSQASLGVTAVEVTRLLLISDHQYAQRDHWNGRFGADHWIPERFDDSRNIAWVPARSIITRQFHLVPAGVCFLSYPHALAEGLPVPDSSGLAFGVRLEDAIERAVLEIIERDAVSIWWYGRVRRPAIEVDLKNLSLWQDFATWMRKSDRSFWVLDLTHDLGMPVAAAVSCNSSGSDLAFGFAAACSLEAAALSAVGELVQFEATKRLLNPVRQPTTIPFLAWCSTAQINENPFLMPDRHAIGAPVSREAESPVDLKSLADRGHDVLVVELPLDTQDGFVVRVLMPGFRFIWPRFAAGRLYDVPFGLAWHERRQTEAELNPTPIIY